MSHLLRQQLPDPGSLLLELDEGGLQSLAPLAPVVLASPRGSPGTALIPAAAGTQARLAGVGGRRGAHGACGGHLGSGPPGDTSS